MKKIFVLLFLTLLIFVLFACSGSSFKNGIVYVYNQGEYINPEVIDMFEKEYNIQVEYSEFETNEEAYPIIEKKAVKYDVICPSEYMIQKMIQNDLLMKIDKTKVPNIKNLDNDIFELLKPLDNADEYSVPYMQGSVGILYNKTLLDEKKLPYPTSYADLWKEEYKGEILMQNSVRDIFMVGLKKNGFSANSVDDAELEIAKKDLISQKPLVQAYVVDLARDKMVAGEASIAVVYSGDALEIKINGEQNGYEYRYLLPKEGTNIWVDCWVILKNAENIENAYKWLDFLCRPEIAKINTEYIVYSTVLNDEYKDTIDKECVLGEDILINDSDITKNELFKYLGSVADEVYNDKWKDIKGN